MCLLLLRVRLCLVLRLVLPLVCFLLPLVCCALFLVPPVLHWTRLVFSLVRLMRSLVIRLGRLCLALMVPVLLPVPLGRAPLVVAAHVLAPRERVGEVPPVVDAGDEHGRVEVRGLILRAVDDAAVRVAVHVSRGGEGQHVRGGVEVPVERRRRSRERDGGRGTALLLAAGVGRDVALRRAPLSTSLSGRGLLGGDAAVLGQIRVLPGRRLPQGGAGGLAVRGSGGGAAGGALLHQARVLAVLGAVAAVALALS